MGKKYVPSGYQIIEIDINRLDGNNVLPKETEDEKVLYDLFINKKLYQKPILLRILNDGEILLNGFAVAYNVNTLFLTAVYVKESALDTAQTVSIYMNDQNIITVKYSEI